METHQVVVTMRHFALPIFIFPCILQIRTIVASYLRCVERAGCNSDHILNGLRARFFVRST